MKTAKISICIPAYQRPHMLHRALSSVLNQAFEDYEVIITDDSADNAVADIVRSFMPNPKINYYKNVARKGSPGNWNEAMRYARGEYIKLLHHDDWFKDHTGLGDLLRSFEINPGAGLGFCACEAYGPDGSFSYVHTPTAQQLARLRHSPYCLFGSNFVGSPSVTIFKKSHLIDFDKNMQWVVDVDFYIRMLNKLPAFTYCERPLVCINRGDALQVSAQCFGNKSIDVPEWLCLYQKFSFFRRMNIAHLVFLWRLFQKHGLRSHADLIACGVNNPVPAMVSVLLVVQRIAYCFYRATKRSPEKNDGNAVTQH